MAVQVNPIAQSLPATTAIQDPATRRFAQAVEDALRALRSEEGAVESLKKAADAMNNAVSGGTPPSIAQWLFSSELYQKLTTEIARIDVEAKQNLLDEALARQTAIDEINATLATIQSTAAYDPLVTYAVGDMVAYDGKLYQAILETTGNLPTNTTYWKKVGEYATLGDVVAAHTLEINDLESRVTTDEGNLTAEIANRQALATQVRGGYTGTDVNLVSQGLIYSERVARATADSNEVSARQSLSAKLLGSTSPDGLTLETLSEGLIFDERQARVSGDGANASSISALRAQVGVTEAGALTTGLILDEKNVRASNDLAIVSAVNTALAQITGVSTSISQSGENLIANWTQAQATKWSQIEAEVLTSGGQTIRAALQQEATTRANADGSLGAQWTLKTDINGYISGFGFASTANNAAPTSEFIIRADKFAVVMPGYGEHVPFAIGDFGPAMFGDGGFSVPVSRLVNQAAQPTSFLETFESGSVAQWTNYSGSGELSVVSVADSLTGGKVLRIGNNSGNDQAWLIHKQNIPFDPSALYRIKFRVRRTAGTGTVYLGVAGVAADGATFVNLTGVNSSTSQHYVAASNQNPGTGWTEYVGYIKGTAATGQSGTNPAVTAPLKLHQSVKYIRPLVLVNYQNQPGVTEVDYCAIELMTDAMSWDVISGAGKPEDGATVGAPAGTLVAGVQAANVAAAVTDFNASNNRNGAAITVPTIPTDGTAVDHVAQKDGSVDISFEWSWSGNEGDIDGFLVYVRPSTSSSAYTLGTTPAEETVYTVPANKRAFVLFGVAADKYYTFGVQAYRAVDKAINAAGVIKSTLVKATGSGENPYRPSSTVAFTGDVTGTISGTNASTVVSNASTALTNANAAQTAANTANAALADIAADNKLTPAEKKSVRKEWDAIYAERAGIRAQADSFGITTEKTNYDNDFQALGTYLNGGTAYTIGATPPSWITDANLATTTTIVGTTFRANWSNLYADRQALLNKIAAEAAKKADWSSVTGSGKPLDNSGRVIDGERTTNPAPQDFPPGETFYFKQSSSVGVTGAGTYGVLRTVRPYGTGADLSGGGVFQWFEAEQLVWARKSTSATAWSSWQRVPNETITPSNVSTYIANAAIGNAQIGGDIWSTNHVAGASGWRIYRDGNAEFRNVTVRGDVEASSLKANTAMVGTLNIAGNAVTIPVSASGTTSCQTASTSFESAPVAVVMAVVAQLSMRGTNATGTQIIAYASLYRGASLIKSIEINKAMYGPDNTVNVLATGTWVLQDTPGPSSTYYRVELSVVGGNSSVLSTSTCSVLALGVKR